MVEIDRLFRMNTRGLLEYIILLIFTLNQVDPSKPESIPKYVDELPIPNVLQPQKIIDKIPYYEVKVEQIRQRLHSFFLKLRCGGTKAPILVLL